MSTNTNEQTHKEIEPDCHKEIQLESQSVQIKQCEKSKSISQASHDSKDRDEKQSPKRTFQLQNNHDSGEENIGEISSDKKVKLSNTEELRKKLQSFRPFTRHENIENAQIKTSNLNNSAIKQQKSQLRNECSKFQVVKNTFVIEVLLINKLIQITAQSRIDQHFILVGELRKQDIPQSLKKSGYTLPSQIFSLMKKNKDQLQIDPLLNLKIVIIEEKGKFQSIRKFKYPLTQKTLTFEERYLKKMKLLEEQNHRLQYQLSQIALDYEQQLQIERKKVEYERQEKQKFLKELQDFKKIDMEDLIAKETMDLDGIIEVYDREKFRPVVQIEQDCEQINVESILDKNHVDVSGPVVDIQKITLQKNYSESVRNQQFLKLLQSVQKVAKNSENINKDFLSLLIDIIVDEDKKTASNHKKFKQNSKELDNLNKQKPLDLSVYRQKFLSGNAKLPQPPQVEIISGPNYIYPTKKVPSQNCSEAKKSDEKHKQKPQKKVEKKIVDITINNDQNKEKIEKQLKEFLFGTKGEAAKHISETHDEKTIVQNLSKRVKSKKALSESSSSASNSSRKKKIGSVPKNSFNTNIQQIELEQQPKILPKVGKQQKENEIEIIEEDNSKGSDGQFYDHDKKSLSQLPTQDQPDIMIISESPLQNPSKSTQNQGFFEQKDQDTIEILNLEEDKEVVNIEEDVTFINKRVLTQKNNNTNKVISGDRFPKGYKNDVYIQKVVSNRAAQKSKPLILNLNHYYKGQNPKMTLQQEKQLLITQSLSKMRPRMGKVFQTSEYQQKKNVWIEFALSLETNDLTQLMSEQNYGDVHKIFKSDKLLGTMAWVELFYNIRVLDLGGNNITYIEGLKNLKRIEKLDLSRNLITKIQNLEYQINMRELYLRENKIQVLQNIFHMKKLDTLSLQNNQIFEIDDKIGEIGSLRYLYLQKNRIRKLRPALKNLRLMAFKIFGNGMNYAETGNKDIIEYLRSTRCDVHLQDFLL